LTGFIVSLQRAQIMYTHVSKCKNDTKKIKREAVSPVIAVTVLHERRLQAQQISHTTRNVYMLGPMQIIF
jgi:hypothetical protein